jgi:hypothetical protein
MANGVQADRGVSDSADSTQQEIKGVGVQSGVEGKVGKARRWHDKRSDKGDYKGIYESEGDIFGMMFYLAI